MTGIGCSAQICNRTMKVLHLYREPGMVPYRTYVAKHVPKTSRETGTVPFRTYVAKQAPNIRRETGTLYRTYVAKQVLNTRREIGTEHTGVYGRQLCRRNHLYAPFKTTPLISVADPKFQLKTKLVLLPGSRIHNEVKSCIRIRTETNADTKDCI
jgi:hypothetical protein